MFSKTNHTDDAVSRRGQMLRLHDEYQEALQTARELGYMAGGEIYELCSYPGAPVPKEPDPSMWQRWSPDMDPGARAKALKFNMHMAYATQRAVGYQDAAAMNLAADIEALERMGGEA